MGIERINRRSSIIGGTGLGGRQQSPVVARGPMFAGYDIPPQEVAELYKFYTQTGGPSWINHTNWFENKQCATWYGLTVAGGRVKEISVLGNNLTGTLSAFPALTACTKIIISNNPVTGTLDTAALPRSVTDFYSSICPNFGVTGAVVGLPPGIKVFYVHDSLSAVTGTLGQFPATATYVSLKGLPHNITGGAVPIAAIAAAQWSFNNMSKASKDSIIERIYADRALFTNAAHTLNISGGPALTGVYQTSAAPATPAEKAYALVNDPNSESFLKWVITL